MKKFYLIVAVTIMGAAIYYWGHSDGLSGRSLDLIETANAVEAEGAPSKSVQATGVAAGVYYPGTEALGPDEMRVVACGTGMPMPAFQPTLSNDVLAVPRPGANAWWRRFCAGH